MSPRNAPCVPVQFLCCLFASCILEPVPKVKSPPMAGFDLPEAVDAFPDSLPHWRGPMAARDRSRLLLSFGKAMTSAEMAAKLGTTTLMLEPEPEDAAPGRAVQHTETEFWVRSLTGNPLAPAELQASGTLLGAGLAWVGAVFRVPGENPATALDSLGGLYCPMPRTLNIRLRPAYHGTDSSAAVERMLARHHLELSQASLLPGTVLGGHIGRPEANVYGLYDSLPVLEMDLVESTAFEVSPLLSPQGG